MKESRKFVMAKTLLDFAKIAFGGVVLVKVMQIDIDDRLLILLAVVFIFSLLAAAFWLMNDKDNDKDK